MKQEIKRFVFRTVRELALLGATEKRFCEIQSHARQLIQKAPPVYRRVAESYMVHLWMRYTDWICSRHHGIKNGEKQEGDYGNNQ